MSDGEPENQNHDFEDLLEYLKTTRGLDLTVYKRPTLRRRVGRRMQQVDVDSIAAYRDYLEVHPEEFSQLFNTILINVTSFFRDPEAWQVLAREIIPAIVSGKSAGDPIRVWSAGCASGEEPFSLAMLWAEQLGLEAFRNRVKIYATDVDDEALGKARQGVFDARQMEAVPPDLRERYFQKNGGRYTFHGDARRAVIFGRHDLVTDAPISHLDLLVCRNTLIYLNAETQSRILARFHFALNDKGFLFLGRAEMLLTHSNLFHSLDLRYRFFSKTPHADLRDRLLALAQTGDSEVVNTLARSVRLADEAFTALPVPQFVVDGEGTLVQVNQAARKMFNLNARDLGHPFQELDIYHEPVELRPLLLRVREEKNEVRVAGVQRMLPDGEVQYLDVQLTPLMDQDALIGVSIVFVDQTTAKRSQEDLQHTSQELETAYEELETTNEELETTNEELETTNEELQSTVEELETTNEELQSTNEEHETMNEELQATNEELQAINEQLRGRTDELNRTNVLLEGVLAGLGAGAVVVDRDMKILEWNPRSEELWGLRSSEVRGQSFADLDIGLPVASLVEPLRACLAGSSGAREVVVDAIDRRGRSMRCRVVFSPLVAGGQMQGAVMMVEERG